MKTSEAIGLWKVFRPQAVRIEIEHYLSLQRTLAAGTYVINLDSFPHNPTPRDEYEGWRIGFRTFVRYKGEQVLHIDQTT